MSPCAIDVADALTVYGEALPQDEEKCTLFGVVSLTLRRGMQWRAERRATASRYYDDDQVGLQRGDMWRTTDTALACHETDASIIFIGTTRG